MFYYLLARLIKVKVRAFMIQTLYHKSCIFPVFCLHLCVPHIFLDGQCYSMTYFELLQMLYPCRTFMIKYIVGCLVFVCLLLSTLKPAFVKRIFFVQKAPPVISHCKKCQDIRLPLCMCWMFPPKMCSCCLCSIFYKCTSCFQKRNKQHITLVKYQPRPQSNF